MRGRNAVVPPVAASWNPLENVPSPNSRVYPPCIHSSGERKHTVNTTAANSAQQYDRIYLSPETMPQPEVCSSEGDADSQRAMSDTQSEPSSEELLSDLGSSHGGSHSLSPRSKPMKLRGPAPPPSNPLQFVKIKPPSHLYTAPPAPKPVVERVRKEEAEDWQNDLDGWKANRRKRQEQLVERVSEFKRQDSDPGSGSRKSKTFSEMMKSRKHNLVLYDDDNEINFSELGLSSADKNKEQQASSLEQQVEVSNNNNTSSAEPNGQHSETKKESKVKEIVSERKTTVVEEECTYEKAIKDYAEFSSTRLSASKPSAAEIVQPPSETNVNNNNNNINKEVSNKKYAATAVKEVKVVTETIIASDSDEFLDTEEEQQLQPQPAPKLEEPAPRAAPVIKSSVVKKLSGSASASMFTRTDHFNLHNNNNHDIFKSKDEPSLPTSPLSPSSSTNRFENLEIKPITDKISKFEKSIEESVLFNPPTKKHRPPVPSKPPKTAPPAPPVPLVAPPPPSVFPTVPLTAPPLPTVPLIAPLLPTVAPPVPLIAPPLPMFAPPAIPKEAEEAVALPVSPGSSVCNDVPDAVRPITELPRALSPRDRSPMGGEDSGVHTADSVSQSDEVEEEDPTAPGSVSSGLLDIISAPIVDHELSALLAPPTKMEPPREKPPPPPPVGTADDTETMRKCFLGLEITKTPPPVPPPVPPPQTNEKKDEFLSNQLKEKLLKLEEEKNNVINLEKKVTAERERLAAEREALRLEREMLQQAKSKQLDSLSYSKLKLGMRSLESLDIIPTEPEGRETPPEDYHTAKNTPVSGSPLKVQRQQLQQQDQHHDYANLPPEKPQQQQQPSPQPRKTQVEEHVHKQERTYVNQAFFQPPQPRYSSLYEDPFSYDSKPEPVVYRKKSGPPPPVKPSNRHSTSALLTRNFSADSILESVDDGGIAAPAVPRRDALAARPSLPLSCSMSQLPKQPSSAPSQQPQLKSQRPRSSSAFGLANYHQHWLVQEAEHRRITEQQQRQAAKQQQQQPQKHLPDAIIMSLTQRVQQRQNSQLPQRTSPQRSLPQRTSNVPPPAVQSTDDKVLSVSGKKKCSHCNLELGRGAAMIIESLRLFYHIDCFKCCVCSVQLGDGLMGTDVRVRNGKLHCHSCYSSDDGVKFSCV
ncbi:Hypothetical predicted protein [Cloeon dipterum]|uniref:LIM zinc-binding domain-containing protein n=1 Tax=Cloeon dipterum TaxID=197152 RepID=A0A8S1CH33_9INSE|nr:Hypothetical predicted protein [Cloeon dipterum]